MWSPVLIFMCMDNMLLELQSLKRKLDNLEYNIDLYRKGLQKSKSSYRYYQIQTRRLKDNIKELKKEDTVVSMNEYKKVSRDCFYSTDKMEMFKMDITSTEILLIKAKQRHAKLIDKINILEQIIASRKVVIIFKGKNNE